MDFTDIFFLGMKRALPPIEENPLGIRINLGAGKQEIHGVLNFDWPDWDAEEYDIPFNDNEVDEIHAYHFLEHLSDPRRMLWECQRVLRPGGVMHIVVPHCKSNIAFDDLDHKSFFNENTWKTLLNNAYYDKAGLGREWKLRIGFNLIAGLNERNMCVFTQLIKV